MSYDRGLNIILVQLQMFLFSKDLKRLFLYLK